MYKMGEANKVSFGEYHGKIPEGSTFTHNHPNNGVFSDTDMLAMSDFKFKEYRAVTNNKVYVMKSDSPVKISKAKLLEVKKQFQIELKWKYKEQFNSLSGEAKQKLNIEINEELNRKVLNHFGVKFTIE